MLPDLSSHAPFAPRLLADIGGTNARFALELAPFQFTAISVVACNDYAELHLAIAAYLASDSVRGLGLAPLRHAAIAIANPVDGDLIRMTNHHWTFSIEQLRLSLQLDTLLLMNDFTALAMALPFLQASERVQIGGGLEQAGKAIALLGPGTGLGVSGIIPYGKHWVPLASEGGHVSFAPSNAEELALLRWIWRYHPHVSAERLISGQGLPLLYQAVAALAGSPAPQALSAAAISSHALNDSCLFSTQAVAHFCAMLGTVAGNLALTLGAKGGVYIGGGIVARLGHLFVESAFRQRFEEKGRFASYLREIPTFLIMAEYPAFLGVSAVLADKLGAAESAF
ncbi:MULTISPECIES: glucokinase [unclassified Undibacterium]|uniref:glucokinase n=1 Tax=unclassified Undibacterium TaxID=2630295 RepID=UPI002AC8E587|nr:MULTISPECIES: glucokinase [unclassified Undibacterium]MEB0139398.1 glucokinase [Undibacterium sp. CCC2.1]MEB0173789.1 glucokinase [Undibacterium sp. CCC1.1]MEB0177428.1 glucokinase [Undibacterium sp. CCC3.4]MEB0216599.1 glucokinase [Undibacterium sp. 5I2]WPX44030.1 glucokinase [Undibacterium sp. CCC3.4]